LFTEVTQQKTPKEKKELGQKRLSENACSPRQALGIIDGKWEMPDIKIFKRKHAV
jgi:hypothetical protein